MKHRADRRLLSLQGETFLDGRVTQYVGDVRTVLKSLPADHFDCVVTSPPYWGLRDYGTAKWEGGDEMCEHERVDATRTAWANSVKGPGNTGKNGDTYANMTKTVGGRCSKCDAVWADSQIGMERTLGEHLAVMVDVFEEVRRVLKPTGTLWLNYGDCYATAPNGRSAADTKAAGGDDRTFRDKPFSTVGPVYDPEGGAKGKGGGAGKNRYKDDQSIQAGRVVSGGYLKAKDLCMIPNRLAIALQEAGWWVRSEIIWHKPNPMPESIKDRPGSSHEKVWLLSKSQRYHYDNDAVKETAVSDHPSGNGYARDERLSYGGRGHVEGWSDVGGLRNLRNVWTIGTAAFSEAHFATFPPALAERCIKAGSPAGGSVLDPFGGSGTTALVAARLGRTAALIELNGEYATMARARVEAAFMGKEEGSHHMVKQLGKTADAGPLFGFSSEET